MREMESASPEALEIVRLAVGATPQRESPEEWRVALGELIPEVWQALNPYGRVAQRAERLLQAKYIRGVLTGVDFEDRSQRGIVTWRPLTGTKRDDPNAIEQARTERIDDPSSGGADVYDAIQDWIGFECEFWVYVEVVDAERKVRVLQHFIPGERPSDTPRHVSTSHQTAQEPGNAVERPPAADPLTPTPTRGRAITEKLRADFGGSAAVDYAKRVRERLGINDPLAEISDDQIEECRRIARDIKAEREEEAF